MLLTTGKNWKRLTRTEYACGVGGERSDSWGSEPNQVGFEFMIDSPAGAVVEVCLKRR